MRTAYDRASMAHLLAQALPPRLLTLLERRIASFQTDWGDLTDLTEILVFEPGDAAADIEREMGFSPLVDVDGVRFGEPAFQPFWDHLVDREGWFELTVTFGSAFAYVLFIADTDGVPHELLTLCRRYA